MLYITLSQWELWVPTLGCHHAFFINTYFFSIWYFPDFIIIFFFHQFSCPVVSDPLWPQGLQHARLPCPSPAPRACSNSSPLSQWCHSTISSSVVHFSSCLQYISIHFTHVDFFLDVCVCVFVFIFSFLFLMFLIIIYLQMCFLWLSIILMILCLFHFFIIYQFLIITRK